MPKPGQSCANCQFRWGKVCARFPPKITVYTTTFSIVDKTLYPSIKESWWCGEWKPKEETLPPQPQ